MKRMTRFLLHKLGLLGLAGSLMLMNACNTGVGQEKVTDAPVKVRTQEEAIIEGEYLVTIGGCNDCHTPKVFTAQGMQLDTSRLLSGHPAGSPLPPIDERALQPGYWVLMNAHLTATIGPWGLTYARNLTPHETGIKYWEEETFIKALRTGKHMGVEMGRPIMPPMPWFNLVEAKEEDLKAIYAYLQSIKPVDNHVPDPISPDEVRKMIQSDNTSL